MYKAYKHIRLYLLLSAKLLLCTHSAAIGDYLSSEQFLQANFSTPPTHQFFWLNAQSKKTIKEIIQRDYQGVRIRYWQQGKRSAWILNEVGKEKPITMGFIIEANSIVQFEVLSFRELRGDEIRYPFFTRQLSGLSLTHERTLTKPIDNITGATMSVDAVKKTAKLALWLARQIAYD